MMSDVASSVDTGTTMTGMDVKEEQPLSTSTHAQFGAKQDCVDGNDLQNTSDDPTVLNSQDLASLLQLDLSLPVDATHASVTTDPDFEMTFSDDDSDLKVSQSILAPVAAPTTALDTSIGEYDDLLRQLGLAVSSTQSTRSPMKTEAKHDADICNTQQDFFTDYDDPSTKQESRDVGASKQESRDVGASSSLWDLLNLNEQAS